MAMNNEELPISVTMITYNHEKYIAESIQSVLDQTFTNFELIIVNDGSTDKTDEIIRTFQDPRITYIYQENQGPSVASNNAILAAKGEYIALMSGDDVCYPQRLEEEYLYATKNKKPILFSWVDFIDDDSNFINDTDHFAKNFFNLENKSRPEILNHFIFRGNYLCGITAFIKRDLLLEAGLFCPTSIQLQDFDMWLKLLLKYDLFMLPQRLLKYRIRSNQENLSANPAYFSRCDFEFNEILKSFFDSLSIDLFREAFVERLKNPSFQTNIEYELEKAFLFIDHPSELIKYTGATRLFNLLRHKEYLSTSIVKYNFCLQDLYDITKNLNIVLSARELRTLKEQVKLAQEQIRGMESSFFWKIRNQWFMLKELFGLVKNE